MNIFKKSKNPTSPAREFIESKGADLTTLNMDTFGAIMDEFLNSVDGKVLIESPPGSQNVSYKDSMGIGPVGVLFFLTKAMAPVAKEIQELAKGDFDSELLADAIADLVKADILEGLKEGE